MGFWFWTLSAQHYIALTHPRGSIFRDFTCCIGLIFANPNVGFVPLGTQVIANERSLVMGEILVFRPYQYIMTWFMYSSTKLSGGIHKLLLRIFDLLLPGAVLTEHFFLKFLESRNILNCSRESGHFLKIIAIQKLRGCVVIGKKKKPKMTRFLIENF